MNEGLVPYNPKNESVVIYRSDDDAVKLEVQLADETVWLTQQQMVTLFDTTKPNVSMHIRNIFKEGELTESATVKKFLTVQNEGSYSRKDMGRKLSAVSLLGINAEDILKQVR